MHERRFGEKYSQLGGYQPAAQIAKFMRADIKAEIAAGHLPGSASNYSVRVHNYYSGGRAIYIEARDLDGMWEECDGKRYLEGGFWVDCHSYDHEVGRSHERLTAEGRRVEKVLKKIHAAYNYEVVDLDLGAVDVNYYGNAEIETAWHRRFRLAEKARKDAKKAKAAA